MKNSPEIILSRFKIAVEITNYVANAPEIGEIDRLRFYWGHDIALGLDELFNLCDNDFWWSEMIKDFGRLTCNF